MIRGSKASVWLVDVVCGFVLAACVAGFLWVTVLRSKETLAEIRRAEDVVEQARHDLAKTKAQQEEQRVRLLGRSKELGQTGQLPARPPVVEYMQTVSQLAVQHHLTVIRHQPAPSRKYAGLFEERIESELSGSLPDLVRFFAAVEESPYWGDIAYLKVSVPPGSAPGVFNNRTALLTFSLFGAVGSEGEPGNG